MRSKSLTLIRSLPQSSEGNPPIERSETFLSDNGEGRMRCIPNISTCCCDSPLWRCKIIGGQLTYIVGYQGDQPESLIVSLAPTTKSTKSIWSRDGDDVGDG
jgi:hypothetical protein